jgi:hypothetical protein
MLKKPTKHVKNHNIYNKVKIAYNYILYITTTSHQWPNFGHCCFGHVAVLKRCDIIFWEFYVKYGIRRAFREDLDLYCRSYGDQRNYFHLRAVQAVQKLLQIFF